MCRAAVFPKRGAFIANCCPAGRTPMPGPSSAAYLDITGGFNLWQADVLRAIDLASVDSAGYSFQVEMKYRALRLGVGAMEVPIHFEDRTIGESKMNLAVQMESIVMPWKLRVRAVPGGQS